MLRIANAVFSGIIKKEVQMALILLAILGVVHWLISFDTKSSQAVVYRNVIKLLMAAVVIKVLIQAL